MSALPASVLVALCAALASAGLCILLRPLLQRYALARPNARSSHSVPTPQGGGLAVLGGVLLACLAAAVVIGMPSRLALLAASVALLAFVGAWDDIRPLPASLRLLLQGVCVGAVLFLVEPQLRVLPGVPLWAERGLALLAGMWFVNLTNFIDGVDWITVATVLPPCATVAAAALLGFVPADAGIVAAALFGGLAGFAPFNRPRARIFLGDVGSLPIGLLAAWLLYRLAGAGGLAAAVILPLYPVADATLTLLGRLARGEKVWQAHRLHFYQQAVDRGVPVLQVVGTVFALGWALAGLAAVTLLWPAVAVGFGCVLAAAVLVAATLRSFAAPRAIR